MPVRVRHRPYSMLDLPYPFVGRCFEYRECYRTHSSPPSDGPLPERTSPPLGGP